MVDFESLPDDPMFAFCIVCREYLDEFEQERESAEESHQYVRAAQRFIIHVAAADSAFEIGRFSELEPEEKDQETVHLADSLEAALLKLVVTNELKLAILRKKNSVALSNEARDEIRVAISKLKSLVEHLDLPEWKKDAITKKILRLEEEIERSRTSLEVVGDFLVSAAAYAEDVGNRLEPWRKWVDSIANLLGQARKAEDNQPQLPAPSRPKEIEGPKGYDEGA